MYPELQVKVTIREYKQYKILLTDFFNITWQWPAWAPISANIGAQAGRLKRWILHYNKTMKLNQDWDELLNRQFLTHFLKQSNIVCWRPSEETMLNPLGK